MWFLTDWWLCICDLSFPSCENIYYFVYISLVLILSDLGISANYAQFMPAQDIVKGNGIGFHSQRQTFVLNE